MVDKKKEQRDEIRRKEEMEEREQQFRLFKKIMFAPRVWNSQAMGKPKEQEPQQDQINKVSEMFKYNMREYRKQMEQMMERV